MWLIVVGCGLGHLMYSEYTLSCPGFCSGDELHEI
jgi:hypothetical protein